MERLDDRVTLLACRFDDVEWHLRGRLIWSRSSEIVPVEQGLQRFKRRINDEDFGDAVADARSVLILGVVYQSMGVRTLNAVHAPGILGLGAIEKSGSHGRREVLSRSVTSSACRCRSWVKAILV